MPPRADGVARRRGERAPDRRRTPASGRGTSRGRGFPAPDGLPRLASGGGLLPDALPPGRRRPADVRLPQEPRRVRAAGGAHKGVLAVRLRHLESPGPRRAGGRRHGPAGSHARTAGLAGKAPRSARGRLLSDASRPAPVEGRGGIDLPPHALGRDAVAGDRVAATLPRVKSWKPDSHPRFNVFNPANGIVGIELHINHKRTTSCQTRAVQAITLQPGKNSVETRGTSTSRAGRSTRSRASWPRRSGPTSRSA